jgi:putative membrane protein
MAELFPEPALVKNDRKAKLLIWSVSIIVFAVVALLSRVQLHVTLPFDVHLFAKANAIINSMVAVLLIAGLITAKAGKYRLHKRIMLTAIVLSVLFLMSYICHHLFAGETKYGDLDGDGVLSMNETMLAGSARVFYIILLMTHIPLASIILPVILFTAYRALIGEYEKHRRLVRITWPIWFYVAVSGVLVYWMISPYYH